MLTVTKKKFVDTVTEAGNHITLRKSGDLSIEKGGWGVSTWEYYKEPTDERPFAKFTQRTGVPGRVYYLERELLK